MARLSLMLLQLIVGSKVLAAHAATVYVVGSLNQCSATSIVYYVKLRLTPMNKEDKTIFLCLGGEDVPEKVMGTKATENIIQCTVHDEFQCNR